MLDDSLPKEIEGNNGMHIQVANRGNPQDQDGSLVVSMEFNGIMYKGVLFAQPNVHWFLFFGFMFREYCATNWVVCV